MTRTGLRHIAPMGDERGLQNALDAVGQPGSRSLLPTPALVCDLDLLSANIATMAAITNAAGLRLRPHAKSHKSTYIARLQLGHGAVGLACAKLAEAEILVDRLERDGYEPAVSVLLTSPTVGTAAASRVAALARKCDLTVVVDHEGGVDELTRATDEADVVVTVLCDVDVGLGRTGVAEPADAVAVVDRITRGSNLRFGGVQGYAGQVQHLSRREERQAADREATNRLAAVVDALEGTGHEVLVRTGGGTGTCLLDVEFGILNELQPGSYVFMDREYSDALSGDPEDRFHQSLTIATTVVSANHPGFVTVDAGLKAMATDAGMPTVVGMEGEVEYLFFGDEHGLVTTTDSARFDRGDQLELVPPHCDPTVDRYERLWLVRGQVLVGYAAVDARGCSQ